MGLLVNDGMSGLPCPFLLWFIERYDRREKRDVAGIQARWDKRRSAKLEAATALVKAPARVVRL